jgi:beta-glucosidase
MNARPAAELGFPPEFVWGAATAAYQIEGAVAEDGRAPSIWDTFCSTPGKVHNGDTGEVACDFYHRHRGDVALMRELGLAAFRFSIAWPRVIPEGRGRVNQAGLDFYDRLVDELLEAGIRPFPTLYHWDLPQVLEDRGGWPARETATAFAEYVAVVADRLGDRVTDWTTHNEPFCSSWLGYSVGRHAPGRSDPALGLAAAHHVLLSHGYAVRVLRKLCPQAQVGIVLDSWPIHAVTDDPRDVHAAGVADALRNRLFFDPVLRGEYPAEVFERFDVEPTFVLDADLGAISEPIDFVGINNYSRSVVAADPETGEPVEVAQPDAPRTGIGWEVYPDGIGEVLTRLHRDYDVQSLYVTENGAAYPDSRSHDGEVRDVERIDYLERYVGSVARALESGVPVRGYFVWSLLDNFEWAHGYSQRFGIVYVDYPTLERVPKSSYRWYRDLIAATRGATVERAAATG